MSVTLPRRLPTRRSPISRAWRRLRGLSLRLRIRSTERYIAECAEDGILDTLSVREFRKQFDQMRVELALIEWGR